MSNKKLIDELREALKQRGTVTEVQREYAKVEERVMMQMYPVTKPCDEIRSSHLRTLESYIGEHALQRIMEGRETSEELDNILINL